LPFPSPPSGLCLPGTRQVRLYITRILCKLVGGYEKPYAANAATALKRHTARVLSRRQGYGSFAASHLPPPGKPFGVNFLPNSTLNPALIIQPAVLFFPSGLSAGAGNASCPGQVSAAVIYCLIFPILIAPQSPCRRVIWTLGPCTKRFKKTIRNGAIPPAGPQGLPEKNNKFDITISVIYNFIRHSE
jgi:hypothetical protein